MTDEGQEVEKEKSKFASLLSKAKEAGLRFLTLLFLKVKVGWSGILNKAKSKFASMLSKAKEAGLHFLTLLFSKVKVGWLGIKNSMRSKAKTMPSDSPASATRVSSAQASSHVPNLAVR